MKKRLREQSSGEVVVERQDQERVLTPKGWKRRWSEIGTFPTEAAATEAHPSAKWRGHRT